MKTPQRSELTIKTLEACVLLLEGMGWAGYANDAKNVIAGKSDVTPMRIINLTIKLLRNDGRTKAADKLVVASWNL